MAIFSGIAAAIGTAFSAVSTFIGGLGVTGSFLLKAAVGIGSSLLSQALAGKPAEQKFSVTSELQAGGDLPRSIIFGRYATAGSLQYANTWGRLGETDNAFLTQVIHLADYPVQGLDQLWANGQLCTIGPVAHPEYGFPVTQYFKGDHDNLWIKFFDGTQTSVDPFLTGKVSSAARPYTADRIGRGVAYAVMTSLVTKNLFSGIPSFRFTLLGAKLYDPSRDTTVGGAGTQRWNDKATWGGDGDFLPAVQIYNLLRGITYGGEWLYGLQSTSAAQVPVAHWIAQINKCRAGIDSAEGVVPTYRSGAEIEVNVALGDAIEGLLTACQGKISEIGGVYKLHLGAPDAPVMAFTDDDILSTEEQSFTPFFGLADTINGVSARYPSPADAWNSKVAPPLYRTDLEVLAGNRRLLADVSLDFVPYAEQVQRLMKSALEEAQRARRHTFVLPPKFWPLEPGDIVAWTSERNGYDAKLFRVDGIVDRGNLDVMIDLTEVDPADYDWDSDIEFQPPVTGSLGPVRPTPQVIVDWSAQPWQIQDSNGTNRRPAIRLSWDGDQPDVAAVAFEIALEETGEVIYRGRTDEPEVGSIIISQNLLPNEDYLVFGRYIPESDRDTDWSPGLPVTTFNIQLVGEDFLDGIITELKLADEAVTTAKMQVAAVTAEILAPNSVTQTKVQDNAIISSKLQNEAVTSLKLANLAVTDAKIAVGAVLTDKIANDAVTGLKIANASVSELKLADLAVSTAKIQVAAVTENILAANSVIFSKIADGAVINSKIGSAAVTAAKMQDAAVTSLKLADLAVSTAKLQLASVTENIIGSGAVTALKIDAGAVTTNALAAGAVTAIKIQAGTITGDKIAANTITGDKILANSITTRELVLTDFQNLVSDGTFFDGTLDSWPSITNPANVSISARNPGGNFVTSTAPTPFFVNLASDPTTGPIIRQFVEIPVKSGDEIELSMDVAGQVLGLNATVRLLVYMHDPDLGFVSTGLTATVLASASGWRTVSTVYKVTNAVRIYSFLVQVIEGGTGTVNVTNIRVRKRMNSELIVDGAITAGKILVTGSGAAINPDVVFEDRTIWESPSAQSGAGDVIWTANNNVAYASNYLYINNYAARNYDNYKWAIDPLKTYLLSIRVRRDAGGTGTFYGIWRFFDYQGNLITTATSGWPGQNNPSGNYYHPNALNAPTSYGLYTLAMGPEGQAAIPAGAKSMSFGFLANYINQAGVTRLGLVQVSEMARGELVVDGAISAIKIQAGAITTDKLDAGAVTAVKIQAGTITGDKIFAGTITGDKIGANVITARELLISDFTNLVQDGIFSRGDLQAWNAIGTSTTIGIRGVSPGSASTNAPTPYFMILPDIGASNTVARQPTNIPVTGGEELWVAYDHAGTGAPINFVTALRMFFNGADGGYVSNSNTAAAKTDTVWTTNTGVVTVPAGATSIYSFELAKFAAAGNGTAYITNVRVWRRSTGELIVDGAITANKIFAGSITTDKLDTGAVTAIKIQAGTITGDKIQAGTITGDKVQANTITGDRMTANTISARELIISDTTNLVAAPSFEYGAAGWSLGSNVVSSGADTNKRSNFFLDMVVGGGQVLNSNVMRVTPGDQFMLVVEARVPTSNVGTGNIQVRLRFAREDGSTPGAMVLTLAQSNITFGLTRYVGYGTAPAETTRAAVDILNNMNTNYIRVFHVGVFRRANSELIVDGSITAVKIAALSITAAQIEANAITGAKIEAGAVTAAKINVATLSSIVANVGTLTAGIIRSSNNKIIFDLTNGILTMDD